MLDRALARAQGRRPGTQVSVKGASARTAASDGWLVRIHGVWMPPTFWPDAQILYSGDGLYWRDPFGRYALAWRAGRPN
jgi:hypothetical protein